MTWEPPYRADLEIASTPPSLNTTGASRNWRHFHRLKKTWQNDLGMLLLAERIPRRMLYATCSASLRFHLGRKRDEGNYRVMLEKALGDALTAGGYLPDDTPEYYRFERVVFEPERGLARTIVTVRYELREVAGDPPWASS